MKATKNNNADNEKKQYVIEENQSYLNSVIHKTTKSDKILKNELTFCRPVLQQTTTKTNKI